MRLFVKLAVATALCAMAWNGVLGSIVMLTAIRGDAACAAATTARRLERLEPFSDVVGREPSALATIE